jgi:hypothetical protein
VGDFKVRWFFLIFNEIRELTMMTSESFHVHYNGLTFLYLMGKKEGACPLNLNMKNRLNWLKALEVTESRVTSGVWRLACRQHANDKDVSFRSCTPNAFHTSQIPYCPSHGTHPKSEIQYKYTPIF